MKEVGYLLTESVSGTGTSGERTWLLVGAGDLVSRRKKKE